MLVQTVIRSVLAVDLLLMLTWSITFAAVVAQREVYPSECSSTQQCALETSHRPSIDRLDRLVPCCQFSVMGWKSGPTVW